jgi:hypothetical protein
MFFLNKNKCCLVRESLWDYTTGCLNTIERDTIDKHLSSCSACQKEYQAYTLTTALVSQVRNQSVPESRLSWRDVESRILLSPKQKASWLRPELKLFAGAGTLAAATMVIMLTMQSVTLHGPLHSINTGPKVAGMRPTDNRGAVAANPEVDTFPDEADMEMLAGSGDHPLASTGSLRHATPRMTAGSRVATMHTRPAPSGVMPSVAVVANSEENVDGGSARVAVNHDYVLPPASSGNDEERNRRYVIDVVANTSRGDNADGGEEAHPW